MGHIYTKMLFLVYLTFIWHLGICLVQQPYLKVGGDPKVSGVCVCVCVCVGGMLRTGAHMALFCHLCPAHAMRWSFLHRCRSRRRAWEEDSQYWASTDESELEVTSVVRRADLTWKKGWSWFTWFHLAFLLVCFPGWVFKFDQEVKISPRDCVNLFKERERGRGPR